MQLDPSELTFPASDEARAYIAEIVGEMMTEFDIDRAEAIGRVNGQWGPRDFQPEADFASEGSLDDLTRELPGWWAKRIYYKDEVKWWVPGATLEPKPYPRPR